MHRLSEPVDLANDLGDLFLAYVQGSAGAYQARQLDVSNVASVCSTHAAYSGSPAVGLPGAAALTGPELVPLYQGGARVAATITQISSYFGMASFAPSLDHSDARNSQYL